ncbi:MAG TPA: NADH-quinone oxidoreductase subunit N [Planctomycetaceae bacterium]|nr:NADH-quinone oxidoreductase subunit N [Planctomycetaceae bacterium]
MKFAEILSRLTEDTVGKMGWFDPAKYWSGSHVSFLDGSVLMFAPEIILVITLVVLMFVRLFDCDRWCPGQNVALGGAFVALILALLQFIELKSVDAPATQEFFTGLLVYDQLTVFLKVFLLLFLVLVVYLTKLSGIPDVEDAPDFYVLLLGSTIGMCLMASANHLLILFLGVEMTSVPSYAMVGFLKGRRLSSEAALKYVVYGAGAAGVMLYGVSLIAGLTGTANLPEIAQRLAAVIGQHPSINDATTLTLLLGVLMVMAGLAFKLSLFPFHFWCPDAFEGASAEVAGFLSVASKGAAFALLVRFCLALIGAQGMANQGLASIYLFIGIGLGVIAAVTATFGNLAAYSQNNIKRLLAYSTIAHAGYMLMGVAAMMVVLNAHKAQPDVNVRTAEAVRCMEGLLFYLWVYLFMNLGAFAIVALIRNEIYSEEIEDYSGLARFAPGLAICMAMCLFSLVGMPPLGGFMGKFMIFSALFKAGFYHWSMWAVLVIGGINTVFSLFYYVRVLKFMFLGDAPERGRAFHLPVLSPGGLYASGLAVLVLLTGVWVEPLSETAREVARRLFP